MKKKVFESDNIIEYFKFKKQGDQINYDELQQFTHYDLKNVIEFHYFKTNTMRRVKEGLIDYGIIIKAIPNIGYYILKSNQVSSYTYRTYIKRPLKQLNKAERILNSTETKSLTVGELGKYNLTMALNQDLMAANDKVLNSNKYKELE